MDSEVTLEFMTGNPQLEVLSGRLKHCVGRREGVEVEDSILLSKRPSAPRESLPDSRGTLLCITSVPVHMIPTDMLHFLAPFKESVHFVRILRPCNPVGPDDPARTPAEYMVLLQMESQASLHESADACYLQCNGKLFNSLEEARCNVVFVSSVAFDPQGPAPNSPVRGVTANTQTPEASATTATPVGHKQGKSLRGEGGGSEEAGLDHPTTTRTSQVHGTTPPAGRDADSGGGGGGGNDGDKKGKNGAGDGGGREVRGSGHSEVTEREVVTPWAYDASTCVICMEKMDRQVLTTVCNHSFHIDCLVKWQDSPCPVCRFHHSHTSQESTCQECSASGNLWVCLICGIVLCGPRHEDHARRHYSSVLHAYALEIETQQVWDFAGDGFVHRLIQNKADGKLVEISDPQHTSGERPQVPARLSDIQEEQLVHSKLEGLAYQYNTLLTSQLQEQHLFYQKQFDRLLEEQERRRRDHRARVVSGADLVGALRHEKRQLEQKLASASQRLEKTREETGFLWELNKSLEANRGQWSERVAKARREVADARRACEEWLPQMEEKVAGLMLKLDGG
ncbi:unnamed protein product, partial [Discosporangium mesarthrocarpum]